MTITEQLVEALEQVLTNRQCHVPPFIEHKIRTALAAYEASKAGPAYRCPVCGVANENAYIRCNQPDCPDGRDSRPLQRCYMANCDHVCAGDVRALAAYEASKGTATGARYQNLKTGGLYEVLGMARLEWNLDPVVVYRSEHDDSLWVRPEAEFHDGRFIRVGGPGKRANPLDSPAVRGPE
jgi:hypothetical protein